MDGDEHGDNMTVEASCPSDSPRQPISYPSSQASPGSKCPTCPAKGSIRRGLWSSSYPFPKSLGAMEEERTPSRLRGLKWFQHDHPF